jgi:hypothetical protein
LTTDEYPLLDSTTDDEFDEKFCKLEEKWDMYGSAAEKMYHWLKVIKSSDMSSIFLI